MNPLTDTDKSLLALYLDLAEDFYALAQQTGHHILDLYSWAAQPHIQAYLNFHHNHTRHIQDRDARQTLHHVLTTAPSDVERRRAATTLLRATRTTPKPPLSPAPTTPHSMPGCLDPSMPSSPATSPHANSAITPQQATELAALLPALLKEIAGHTAADLPPPQPVQSPSNPPSRHPAAHPPPPTAH
ncbi:MAG: hypothetical protein IT435_15325 [Phycisphaerales bacterium]|nr:hypothetical protein [Phycisphaerales bacterium]